LKTKNKIAIISNSHLGKDVRLYYKIAKSLSIDNDIRIFTPRTDTDLESNPSFQNCSENSKKLILRKIYAETLLFNPSYVICVEPLTIMVGIALKKKINCKIGYDNHEFYTEGFAERFSLLKYPALIFYTFLEKFLIGKLDFAFAVNHYLKKKFIKKNIPVNIIPNYPILNNAEDNINSEKIYDFVYVGGIHPEKGIEVLIKAISLFKKRDVTALIVGQFIKKYTLRDLEKCIEKHHLTSKIKYGGVVEQSEINNILESAKFGFCMHNPKISRYTKALPIKLLEYLKAGLPTITNNFEIIKENFTEKDPLYFSKYNYYEIFKKMKEALNTSDIEYQNLSNQAKLLIKNKFNWNLIEPKLKKFIQPKNNLLLFAYFYPPIGGPGVQRPTKLVSYLKNENVSTDVITVKDIIFHSFDYGLLKEDKAENVIRTNSWDVMSILKKISSVKNNKKSKETNSAPKIYFNSSENFKKIIRSSFLIDDKLGWLPFAYFAGKKLIERKKYQAIVATIGPYTSSLISYFLSKKYKIPLVIDYRDHWTMNPYLTYLTKFHLKFAEYFERRILNYATMVTTVSQTMREDLIRKFGEHLSDKIFVMYNGWDVKDFESVKKISDKNKIMISYIGNFYANRSAEYFLKAVEELVDEEKLPENLEFNFVGNYYKETQAQLLNPKIANYIKITPQLEHDKAIEFLMNSDALLLFIASKNGKGVLTGKIFEYLRSGKEILAMVPLEGEAAEILRKNNHKFLCPMENVEQIKDKLMKLIVYLNSGKKINYNIPFEYSRERQSINFLKNLQKRLIEDEN
jgi:glycosyltransferase involved in cell wall biosynthesis